MKVIWLKSSCVAVPAASLHGASVIQLEVGGRPFDFGRRVGCDAIVLEVGGPEDAMRVFELMDDMDGARPVWIYEPAATVESTVAFIKSGASAVFTSLEAIQHAVATFDEGRGECRIPGTHLIGSGTAMREVAAIIELVADRRCNLLIGGETGTGKEVVAREIHQHGNRSRGPWVTVNCSAIPDTLLEAELFGHVRGAFTGAVQSRMGKFEAANHGTIFLDEIGDMPFPVQAKLLRILQEKEVERLGGNEKIRLDVRVIAATNSNLREKVKAGLFRQDLYYRLNVFDIALPPLRERMEDLPVLARHFVEKVCAAENVRPKSLDKSAMDHLLRHNWPGNVRELENVMEMAVILSGPRSTILACDIRIHQTEQRELPHRIAEASLPVGGLDYQHAIETYERDLLTQALARTRGNKTAAAELLGLKRTTLSARMRVLEARMPSLAA